MELPGLVGPSHLPLPFCGSDYFEVQAVLCLAFQGPAQCCLKMRAQGLVGMDGRKAGAAALPDEGLLQGLDGVVHGIPIAALAPREHSLRTSVGV